MERLLGYTWSMRILKFWREFVLPILVVVVIMGSFRSAVADWNDVPTGSMKPTILEGDRIFVNKLAYDVRIPFTDWRIAVRGAPRRGDIVVFFPEESDTRMVKRIMGVPGDRIEIRGNRLYVNDEPASYGPIGPDQVQGLEAGERAGHRFATETIGGLEHPIMTTPARTGLRTYGPVRVPAGHYFMLGDNRDNSYDSRWFGFVERRRIKGQATAIALSVDPERYYAPRWSRFLTRLR